MAFIWIYGTLFTTAFEAHIPVIYVENSRKEMSEWLTFIFCGRSSHADGISDQIRLLKFKKSKG